MKQFKIKTEVCFSEDAIDMLLTFKDKRAVIITDPFMRDSGVADRIVKKLSNCTHVAVFSDVVPDPPMDLIVKGVKFLCEQEADIIVALGGGSSIDAAKAIAFMAKKIDATKDYYLVAIPTTSGTGSEVTQFAVITDSETGVKYPLANDELTPDMAILDPEFVKTAPPAITADTGIDVITHALEAYVSEKASDCSDCLAEKACELAFEYLPKCYRNGFDIKARDKMHRASCLAGMAFNTVNLGLNHGIAHALGAIFHIPHGRANGLVLPHVIEFNADMARDMAKHSSNIAIKYQKMARVVGLPAPTAKVGVQNLINEIVRLMMYMDRPRYISQCGVALEDFEAARPEIIKRALNDACTVANPRPVSADDINKILDKIAK